MPEAQVFINYSAADAELAARIRGLLEAEGIHCAMPSSPADIQSHLAVVNQLESIVGSFGVVVTLVSRAALQDNMLVANAQHSCEQAGRRKVLVIFQVEEIPSQNPLTLYYAQAALINASGRLESSFARLLTQVKRILDRPDIPKTLRPRRISQRFIMQLLVLAVAFGLMLGAGNYFLPGLLAAKQQTPDIIATPVIFEDPYSGASLDQGITSDRRYVPESRPHGDPASEAPFRFQPEKLHKRFSFDDPALENVNVLDDGRSTGFIAWQDQFVIRQAGGALQLSVAPQSEKPISGNYVSLGVPFDHLVRTGSLEYLGIRFRLDDYPGWSDVDNPNVANIGLQTTKDNTGLVGVDLGRQQAWVPLQPGAENKLGTLWHVLEALPGDDPARLDLALDGVPIGKSDKLPDRDRFAQLVANLDTRSSTDWVNLYFHEVVFGGNLSAARADRPEDASFLVTPDEVLIREDFETLPGEDVLSEGRQFARAVDGRLAFNLQDRADHSMLRLAYPADILTMTNYFAMRYRILDNGEEYWSSWGNLAIMLRSPDLEREMGHSIGVQASRYGAEYTYFAGKNRINGVRGSRENFQPGSWHTMEMVLKPVGTDLQRFLLQYWHDGCFVGEAEVEYPQYFIGAHPYGVSFEVDSGDHRHQDFAGEIDELTAGFIAFPGLEGVQP